MPIVSRASVRQIAARAREEEREGAGEQIRNVYVFIVGRPSYNVTFSSIDLFSLIAPNIDSRYDTRHTSLLTYLTDIISVSVIS